MHCLGAQRNEALHGFDSLVAQWLQNGRQPLSGGPSPEPDEEEEGDDEPADGCGPVLIADLAAAFLANDGVTYSGTQVQLFNGYGLKVTPDPRLASRADLAPASRRETRRITSQPLRDPSSTGESHDHHPICQAQDGEGSVPCHLQRAHGRLELQHSGWNLAMQSKQLESPRPRDPEDVTVIHEPHVHPSAIKRHDLRQPVR